MNDTEWEKKRWEEEESVPKLEETAAPPTGKRRKSVILVVSVILVSTVLVWYFLIRRHQASVTDHPDPVPQLVEENLPTYPGDEIVPEVVPNTQTQTIEPSTVSLADSDPSVREQAVKLSSLPHLSSLLLEEDLIRRFVAGTQAIALGESPAKTFDPLAPKTAYRTMTLDNQVTVDPRSFRRYDKMMELLLSLDPDLCANLYLRFEPQIEAASLDLGNHNDGPFINTVQKAVVMLQQTPLPPDRPELVEKTLSFAYADPAFEQLNAAQKHFLRLGPSHLRQLKGKMTLMLDTLLKRKKM